MEIDKELLKKLHESVKFEPSYQILATLFRGDQILATGIAMISEADTFVYFFPQPPKTLDGILNGKVVLIEKKTSAAINLIHSQLLLESSSDWFWAFERVA